MRTEKEWVDILTAAGVFWTYDYEDDLKRPHALSTEGNHLDKYFNCEWAIEAGLLHDMCIDLIQKGPKIVPDMIIGCGGSGNKVAEIIGALRGISFGCAKKVIENDKEKMQLSCKIGNGKSVILVDDVFNSGKTLRLTAQAVKEQSAFVMNPALVLLNRSYTAYWSDGKYLIALIKQHMLTWTEAECRQNGPCAHGSKAVRLKDNWEQLTAVAGVMK